jgi:nicotinamidase-related amidase
MFGRDPAGPAPPSLAETFVTLSRRAGKPLWIPPDVADLCCSTPWRSKGYHPGARVHGALFPQVQAAMPDVNAIERRNMNAWEDNVARDAIKATGRKRLLVAGLLTEACVSFPAISALREGYEVFVVGDTCSGLTPASHDLALRRLKQAGAQLTSWIQVLLEFQRDWTRHETYEAARGIVVENGGGYGMGLAYAREMIHPA